MSRRIYKFAFERPGLVALEMDPNAELLCVHEQHGMPTLWAEVDADASRVAKRFMVIGTGHDMPSGNFEYIGTAFCGSLVWHVYEVLA